MVKPQISALEKHIQDVLTDKIITCKLTKLAYQRHINDLKTAKKHNLYFDEKAGQRVIDFFHNFLKHSKAEWAGKPFLLEPWQQFILYNLFGWKRTDGTRRFRTAYIECARKNGKSTLLAGIGLFMLAADSEPGSEVYSCAVKRDQAIITHSEATRMVRASSDLKKKIGIFKNNLHIISTNSKYEPLGKDADSLDGLNVHGALIDELHAHKTREMWDVMETATSSRRQPLQIAITTAGFDRDTVCWEMHEYSDKILREVIEDDTFFPIIYTIDEGDDWQDEKVWPKANPNLFISVKIDDLRRKAKKAKELPSAINNFLRKHLCLWVQQSERWISMELWDSNYKYPINEQELKGKLCFGGIDLSAVSDLTAWVMLFPNPDDNEQVDILVRLWCPEARLYDASNRYRDQYQAWKHQGYLTVTSGNAIDYEEVKTQILLDTQNFAIDTINIDRLFQGYAMAMDLAKELGEERITTMGMGFLSMAAPMKELESRLLKRKLNHGNNPILRFCADNVVTREDPAGNKKPDKANSQGKIDGIVGILLALDRAMRREKQGSKYENEGLTVIG